MGTKFPQFTRLEAVCSGDDTNHFYMVAIDHRMPDPIADMVSSVHRVVKTGDKLAFTRIIKSSELLSDPSKFGCVVRDPSGTLFLGEDNGFIRSKNGHTEVFPVEDADGMLMCAYVRGPDDIVFGTYDGEIVHVNGAEVSVGKVGRSRFEHITACLLRFHGLGPDFIIVVGDGGNVGRYKDGKWARIRTPSNVKLEAVWCRSENEIYIGGWQGHAWRWDGQDRWQRMEVEFDGDMGEFYICDFAEYRGVLYAACSDNGIYRLDGDRWVPVPKVKDESVGRLAVINIGLVGLGALWGERGSWFTHFDGTTWSAQQVRLKQ